jgi:hypothetical protein
MMRQAVFAFFGLSIAACSSASDVAPTTPDASGSLDATATPDGSAPDGSTGADASAAPDSASGNACTLAVNTTPTSKVSADGCAVLTRDASACNAARVAAGLTGDWLKFSCRVTLTVDKISGPVPFVLVSADSQPDYLSNYFATSSACYENYQVKGMPTPNKIAVQSVKSKVPLTPDAKGVAKKTNNAGVAVNGVWLFNDAAAPPDDIYKAINSFDRCTGHPDPQNGGTYHYHIEPTSISNDDTNLVGVMRDGYFVYGRRDLSLMVPTDLDANGGHTTVTSHSPNTPVYHYHLKQETSTSPGTLGQVAWFVGVGNFHGSVLP